MRRLGRLSQQVERVDFNERNAEFGGLGVHLDRIGDSSLFHTEQSFARFQYTFQEAQ